MPGRRLHDETGGALPGGQPDYATVEWHQPGGKLLAGSFIFCEARAFRQVGGFSNELFAGEEIDLSRRLKRLARERKKRIVILHRHPLLTSARKMHLYTPGSISGFC